LAIRNDAVAWGWPARLLHWLIAVLVVGLWVLGKIMVGLPDADPSKFGLYQLHKSFGLTVFALGLLRLAWRFANPSPEPPPGMPGWERLAAKVSHAMLYLLLLAIPISGYLMVSASPWGIPTIVFGLLHVPHALPPDAATERLLKAVHEALGLLLALLVLLHAAAALKHHLLDRDPVLRRMIRG
jgi:cytochrome b561